MQLLCVVSNDRIPRLFVALTAGGSSTKYNRLRRFCLTTINHKPHFRAVFLSHKPAE